MTAPPRELAPAISVVDMQRRLASELPTSARLGYVVLLMTAMAMAVVTATLWTTEPDLPLRARSAFGLMTVIAASWCVFAVWTLTRRRVLLVRHQLIAARMGVGFSAAFAAFWLLSVMSGAIESLAGGVALSMTLPLLIVAMWRLRIVGRRYDRLTSRYRELDAVLRPSPVAVEARDGRS